MNELPAVADACAREKITIQLTNNISNSTKITPIQRNAK